MNKFFFISALFIFSPTNEETKYYNHNKWKWTTEVMGWWFYEHVREKPVQVKEIFYGNKKGSPVYPRTEIPAYRITRFDKEGNIIYAEEVFEDSTHFICEYEYSNNGKQMKEYVVNKAYKWGFDENDTSHIKSKNIGKGIFQIESYNASGIHPNPSFSLQIFSNNERRMKEEELLSKAVLDTIGELVTIKGFSDSLEKSSTTITEYNENDLITTYDYKDNKGDGFTYLYYYDRNGFIDSVVEKVKGINGIIYSFVNNKYGDVVKSSDATYEYSYDHKGNWIKRTGSYIDGTFIVVREIEY